MVPEPWKKFRMFGRLFVACPLLIVAVSVSGSAAQDPVVIDVQGGQIRVVTVAAGLVHPWSLAHLPNGSLLVAESAGRLRMIRDGRLAPEAVWTAPGEGGEQDCAVDPGEELDGEQAPDQRPLHIQR